MRQQILLHLLNISFVGNLPYGSINKMAEKFGYSRRTITYLWNKAEKQKQTSEKYDLDHNYHKYGRKRITVPYESIASIQMGDRTCIRDLASKLNLALSTVLKMIKREELILTLMQCI